MDGSPNSAAIDENGCPHPVLLLLAATNCSPSRGPCRMIRAEVVFKFE